MGRTFEKMSCQRRYPDMQMANKYMEKSPTLRQQGKARVRYIQISVLVVLTRPTAVRPTGSGASTGPGTAGLAQPAERMQEEWSPGCWAALEVPLLESEPQHDYTLSSRSSKRTPNYLTRQLKFSLPSAVPGTFEGLQFSYKEI